MTEPFALGEGRAKARPSRRALVAALVLAACGDNLADAPDAAVDPTANLDDTDAWVEVSLRFASDGFDDSTYIRASTITDPPLWPYAEPSREGACRMWTREVEICEEFCEILSESCIGGECRSPVPSRSAGALTIDGGGETRTVSFADGAYQHFERALPFAPGTELTASAPGDVVGAFQASAVVPRRLELLDIEPRVVVTPGQPLVLRWRPDDPGSRVRFTLGADLGHALHRPVVIECDAPDELGSIAVPQGMVDELADWDNWGCGFCIGQEAKRYRRARTMAGALPITFWVSHHLSFDLRPASAR